MVIQTLVCRGIERERARGGDSIMLGGLRKVVSIPKGGADEVGAIVESAKKRSRCRSSQSVKREESGFIAKTNERAVRRLKTISVTKELT